MSPTERGLDQFGCCGTHEVSHMQFKLNIDCAVGLCIGLQKTAKSFFFLYHRKLEKLCVRRKLLTLNF